MKADSNKHYHLCFDTLANELRMKIIDNLKEKPLSVEEIAKEERKKELEMGQGYLSPKDCRWYDTNGQLVAEQKEWNKVSKELEAENLKLAYYDDTLVPLLGDVKGKKILDYTFKAKL